MSQPHVPELIDGVEEAEVVDGELIEEGETGARLPSPGAGSAPVLAPAHSLAIPVTALPAVQAAVAAATGFVAGAATLALVRRRSARRPVRPGARRTRTDDGLSIVATRSFLVDVHLIGRPQE
jgi:hypothetical protein